MEIKYFLDRYPIKLDPEIEKVCNDGLIEMQKSKDPSHDEMHVLDLIGILDVFLQNTDFVKSDMIDFNILLPAICWHDVWKSRRTLTKSLFTFKFEQMWDGIGSAKIFRTYSKSRKLTEEFIESVILAIKHHGGVYRSKLTDRYPIEVRTLCDIDNLGFWSMKRLEYVERTYFNSHGTFRHHDYIPLMKWILKSLAKKRETYFFEWSVREFERRKRVVLEIGNVMIKTYEQYKAPIFPYLKESPLDTTLSYQPLSRQEMKKR